MKNLNSPWYRIKTNHDGRYHKASLSHHIQEGGEQQRFPFLEAYDMTRTTSVPMKKTSILARPTLLGASIALAFAGSCAQADPLALWQFTTTQASSPTAQASRAVQINASALANLQNGSEFIINLGNTAPLTAVLKQTISHSSGNKTIVAQLKGYDSAYSLVLTTGSQGSFGDLRSPDGEYQILSNNGQDWVVDLKASGLSPAANQDRSILVPPPRGGQNSNTNSAEASTIDLLLLYTPELANQYGTALQARLDHLVALSNVAYQESGVNLTLRLVHQEAVTSSTTSNAETLQALTHSQGDFANVGALRNQYGADLVALLRPLSAEHRNCGTAWINGANGQDIKQYADYGYAVVSDGVNSGTKQYCNDYSLTQSLAHNMGSLAERSEYSDGLQGAYPYAYDHVVLGQFGTLMTAMTPKLGVFSNPDQLCLGTRCGVAEDQPSAANNAKALNQTRSAVANFRASVVANPSTASNKASPRSSSSSTLTWSKATTGSVSRPALALTTTTKTTIIGLSNPAQDINAIAIKGALTSDTSNTNVFANCMVDATQKNVITCPTTLTIASINTPTSPEYKVTLDPSSLSQTYDFYPLTQVVPQGAVTDGGTVNLTFVALPKAQTAAIPSGNRLHGRFILVDGNNKALPYPISSNVLPSVDGTNNTACAMLSGTNSVEFDCYYTKSTATITATAQPNSTVAVVLTDNTSFANSQTFTGTSNAVFYVKSPLVNASATTDTDGDGIPDAVEWGNSTNWNIRDNKIYRDGTIFDLTVAGVLNPKQQLLDINNLFDKSFIKQQFRDLLYRESSSDEAAAFNNISMLDTVLGVADTLPSNSALDSARTLQNNLKIVARAILAAQGLPTTDTTQANLIENKTLRLYRDLAGNVAAAPTTVIPAAAIDQNSAINASIQKIVDQYSTDNPSADDAAFINTIYTKVMRLAAIPQPADNNYTSYLNAANTILTNAQPGTGRFTLLKAVACNLTTASTATPCDSMASPFAGINAATTQTPIVTNLLNRGFVLQILAGMNFALDNTGKVIVIGTKGNFWLDAMDDPTNNNVPGSTTIKFSDIAQVKNLLIKAFLTGTGVPATNYRKRLLAGPTINTFNPVANDVAISLTPNWSSSSNSSSAVINLWQGASCSGTPLLANNSASNNTLWSYSAPSYGNYALQMLVTDGNGSTSSCKTVNVTDTKAPTVGALSGPSSILPSATSLTLTIPSWTDTPNPNNSGTATLTRYSDATCSTGAANISAAITASSQVILNASNNGLPTVLTNGDKLYYKLKVTDAATNPAYSNCLTLNVSANQAPTAPTINTNPTTTSSSVTLSWSASTDPDGTVAGYNIYRDGTKINTSVVTATSYTDSGLTPNTSYTYTVKAYDNANPTAESSSSNTLTVSTQSVTADPYAYCASKFPNRPVLKTILNNQYPAAAMNFNQFGSEILVIEFTTGNTPHNAGQSVALKMAPQLANLIPDVTMVVSDKPCDFTYPGITASNDTAFNAGQSLATVTLSVGANLGLTDASYRTLELNKKYYVSMINNNTRFDPVPSGTTPYSTPSTCSSNCPTFTSTSSGNWPAR